MPTYLFKNPETNEVKEVVQRMSEKHTYSEGGVEWIRIWTIPRAIVDGKMDVWSTKEFVEKTGRMKGSVGDIWDLSREASEKRQQEVGGKDPIKEKYFNDYSANRKGKKHPQDHRSKKERQKK